MNVFFVLFVLLPVAELSYQIIDSGLDDLWEGFKIKFEKKYDTPVIEVQRRLIWERNFRHVIFHNREADKGMQTFWLAINDYADMNGHEFVAMKNGLKPRNLTSHKPKLTFVDTDVNDLPTEVDWRNEGYVTEVKNQGLCGACWAFSATGSLEAQHFKKTNKLISLSEQQLVDCCTDHDVNNAMTVSSSDFVAFGNNLDKPSACAICFEGNQGCNGGIMDSAFECIKDRGGIMSEIDYPYEAKNGHCDFDTSKVVATCIGHVALKSGSEEALQKAVATVGPISAGIDAGHYTFILYSHGVYKSENCSPIRLDHGVLVVGYGTEDGTDYWLVKNSWGKIWGMDGYVKMARNYKNMCGIATQTSYPLV